MDFRHLLGSLFPGIARSCDWERNLAALKEVGGVKKSPVEWPTLAVAACIYGGFGLATWYHREIPWWVLLPLGGYLVAWQGSLQHEVVHGHPTPWPWLNEALVLPSLWLWLPFRRYRESHLTHHNDEFLTDPLADPESYYVSSDQWDRASKPWRLLLTIRNSLAGRLIVGPLLAVFAYIRMEIASWGCRDTQRLPALSLHLASCALTLYWVLGICGMSFWSYLLFFAYPGLSLTLLRSYLEHRAHPNPAARTAVVEAEWPLALMFLNNNLHVAHHEAPGLAWYKLPARFRADRERMLLANGGYFFKGYREVVRRYFFHAKEHPNLELALARRG